MDLLFLKSKGVENEGERAYLLMLEKASMLIVLFFILMITVALELPGWAVGLIVGAHSALSCTDTITSTTFGDPRKGRRLMWMRAHRTAKVCDDVAVFGFVGTARPRRN